MLWKDVYVFGFSKMCLKCAKSFQGEFVVVFCLRNFPSEIHAKMLKHFNSKRQGSGSMTFWYGSGSADPYL